MAAENARSKIGRSFGRGGAFALNFRERGHARGCSNVEMDWPAGSVTPFFAASRIADRATWNEAQFCLGDSSKHSGRSPHQMVLASNPADLFVWLDGDGEMDFQ